MMIALGVVCSAFGLLYVGQLISVFNLPVAQRLGLQEKPDAVDPLYMQFEFWTAIWDLIWFWTLPAAGIFILLDHAWWPYAALVGGSAYVDTGGREGAKAIVLFHHGIAIGSPRVLGITYIACIVAGAWAIVAALFHLAA